MDPLSIAASIVGLLAAAGKTTILLHQTSSLRDAPASVTHVFDEMTATSAALTELQNYLNNAASVSVESRRQILLQNVVVTVTGSIATYSELEEIVDGSHVGVGRMKVFDKLRWVRKETEIQDIIRRMQNQKGSLSLMLSILQCTSQRDMETTMIRFCNVAEQAINNSQDLHYRIRRLENGSPPTNNDRNLLQIRDTAVSENSNLREGLVSINDTAAIHSTQILADVAKSCDITLPPTTGDIGNRYLYDLSRPGQQPQTPVFQIRDPEMFLITVERLRCGKMELYVYSHMTCLQLKERLQDKGEYPPNQQYLIHSLDKRWMPNAVTLGERKVQAGSVIHVTLPIWGRGSL